MSTIYGDIETFSEVPLNHGTHRYAERAEIILVQWAIDDDPVKVSEDVRDLPDFNRFDRVVFHNSYFDRTLLRVCADIHLPLHKLHDTYVMAYMHSLPGALGKLSTVFNLPVDEAKDKEGKKLIQLFCKPRPKRSKLRRATKETHPEEWRQFRDVYGPRDITSMRVIYKKLPKWNMLPEELEAWHLDQETNDRGFAVDTELVNAAITMCAEERAILAAKTAEVTNDEVMSATQRDALLAYIRKTFDVWLPDLKGATIEKFLKDNDSLSQELVDLLDLRERSSMASVSKYNALARSTSSDGRLRGTLQFCGAARTGRWAGRIFQPHNLVRPDMKNAEIEAGIKAIKLGVADLITDNRMKLASNATRGAIVAAPGKKLVASDLKNIEGRGLAWLADETWKLKAFADFDAGRGFDIYILAYCRAHGLDPQEIAKDKRQLGKVMELALGYEGGVGAFVTFVMTYRIDLKALTADALPRELWREAQDAWHWMKTNRRPTYGLDQHIWVTCDTIKRAWRKAHPATCQLWRDAENAFRDAVCSSVNGREFAAGKHLKFRRDGAWVRMVLPSGRSLCYPQPKVSDAGKISYMGVHQWTKQWARIGTYGGKIIENADQALARDVLRDGLRNVRNSNMQFDLVLSVHDEAITEAPDDDVHTKDELSRMLTTNIPWAEGLPLAADGFEALRYKKED